MKILLVEDQKTQLFYWSKALSKLGHRIVPARNGIEALEMAKESPVDVMITDAVMPGMDGYELAIKIREIDGELPIIMMTADVEYKLNADDHGINFSLLKPVSIENLKIAILAYGKQINCGYMS